MACAWYRIRICLSGNCVDYMRVVIAFRYFVVYIFRWMYRTMYTYGRRPGRYANSPYVSPRKLTAPTAYALERLFVIKFLARTMNWNAFDWPTSLCIEGQRLNTRIRYYVDVYPPVCAPLRLRLHYNRSNPPRSLTSRPD